MLNSPLEKFFCGGLTPAKKIVEIKGVMVNFKINKILALC